MTLAVTRSGTMPGKERGRKEDKRHNPIYQDMTEENRPKRKQKGDIDPAKFRLVEDDEEKVRA